MDSERLDVLSWAIAPFVRYADNATRRPWRLGPVSLLDYLLVHVQQGIMRVRGGGAEIDIKRDEFCLVEPCSFLELEGDETVTPFLRFDVFHDEHRADRPLHTSPFDLLDTKVMMQPRLSDVAGAGLPLRLNPCTPELFASTMHRAVAAWLEGDPLSRLEANHLAADLVVTILRDHSSLGSLRTNHRLDWVEPYIGSRLSDRLTLDELSRRARLSRSQFTRLFTEQFGVPPHRYVVAFRVRRAQDMLRDTNLSHERIAEYCGFADTYHFSKTFKRLTGTPPATYRRRWMPPSLVRLDADGAEVQALPATALG